MFNVLVIFSTAKWCMPASLKSSVAPVSGAISISAVARPLVEWMRELSMMGSKICEPAPFTLDSTRPRYSAFMSDSTCTFPS